MGGLAQAGAAQIIATVDVGAGEDDWSLPPTEEHPRPVVLVHGTFGNRGYTWTQTAPLLRQHGYRVFRPDYGRHLNPILFGLGDIKESARRLGEFVDEVPRRTGAGQVDMVGFSQGGMMPRYYLPCWPRPRATTSRTSSFRTSTPTTTPRTPPCPATRRS